jgi:hypothetical protein
MTHLLGHLVTLVMRRRSRKKKREREMMTANMSSVHLKGSA